MERRTEERVSVDVEIRFRYPDVFKARVVNYCNGGLRAKLPFSVDVDSPVEMEIFGGRLLAGGYVRWLRVEEGEIVVGVAFRDEDRDIIGQIRSLKGGFQ